MVVYELTSGSSIALRRRRGPARLPAGARRERARADAGDDGRRRTSSGATPRSATSRPTTARRPGRIPALVDACHAQGIAVIADSVYAHAHPEFAYDSRLPRRGVPNAMIGSFEGEFFAGPRRHGLLQAVHHRLLPPVNRIGWTSTTSTASATTTCPAYSAARSAPATRPRLPHLPAIEGHRPFPVDADGGQPDHPVRRAPPRPARDPEHHLLEHGVAERAVRPHPGQARRATSTSTSPASSTPSSSATRRVRQPGDGDLFPVAPFQYMESHDHGRFVTSSARRRRTTCRERSATGPTGRRCSRT